MHRDHHASLNHHLAGPLSPQCDQHERNRLVELKPSPGADTVAESPEPQPQPCLRRFTANLAASACNQGDRKFRSRQGRCLSSYAFSLIRGAHAAPPAATSTRLRCYGPCCRGSTAAARPCSSKLPPAVAGPRRQATGGALGCHRKALAGGLSPSLGTCSAQPRCPRGPRGESSLAWSTCFEAPQTPPAAQTARLKSPCCEPEPQDWLRAAAGPPSTRPPPLLKTGVWAGASWRELGESLGPGRPGWPEAL